ncbi:MAG TPA: HTTM domain-containing protein [Ohtaekwangia sp.]|uniref:HTTM domain-containing protein n=1 Tax=Ohtaekwangia sp. TaxID=2066019 RepID=UPI002F91C068
MLTDKIISQLSADFHQQKAVTIFCKALVVFTLFRVLALWSISGTIAQYQHLSWPGSWFGKLLFLPSVLAHEYVTVIYSIFLILLVVGLFIPWSYFSAAVFFWIVANLYRITLPITSGADQTHFMLSLIAIGLATVPRMDTPRSHTLQIIVYNATVLIAQVIVVGIYFLSGWDKLITPSWRTGEAFQLIANLQHMIHPFFQPLLTNTTVNLVLAWCTIAFELTFVILVWFRRTRVYILAIGVIFHLIIAVALNLYSFSLIMIVSYMIFLKDGDYAFVLARRGVNR